MKNVKLITTLVALGLVIIFIVQNAAVVEINFLFWSLEMSRSLLILILLCIGIIAGWFFSSFIRLKRHSK